MSYKSKDGWSELYPYDFYVYKHKENDVCPECGRKPFVFRVPVDYHNQIDIQFTCASGHRWIQKVEKKS